MGVYVKKLSPDELARFDKAKAVEVGEWIGEKVPAQLREDDNVTPEQMMKMRWVLT